MSAQVRSVPSHRAANAASADVGEPVAGAELVEPSLPLVEVVVPEAHQPTDAVGVPGRRLLQREVGVGGRLAEGGVEAVADPEQQATEDVAWTRPPRTTGACGRPASAPDSTSSTNGSSEVITAPAERRALVDLERDAARRGRCWSSSPSTSASSSAGVEVDEGERLRFDGDPLAHRGGQAPPSAAARACSWTGWPRRATRGRSRPARPSRRCRSRRARGSGGPGGPGCRPPRPGSHRG